MTMRVPSRKVRTTNGLKAPETIVNRMGRLAARSMRAEMDQLLGLLQPALMVVARTDGFFEEAGAVAWSAYTNLKEGFIIVRKALIAQYDRAHDAISKYTANELARLISVDPSTAVPNYEQVKQKWVNEGVAQIKASDDLKRRIEKIIIANPNDRVEALAKKIRKATQIEVRRAELIARDQVLRAYGRLQELRQQTAGIANYVWTTVKDGRVREVHQGLEGTVQSWAKPPVAHRSGITAHPGQIFQCRCTPYPILEDTG